MDDAVQDAMDVDLDGFNDALVGLTDQQLTLLADRLGADPESIRRAASIKRPGARRMSLLNLVRDFRFYPPSGNNVTSD